MKLFFCKKPARPPKDSDNQLLGTFDSQLTLKYQVPELPSSIKIERLFFVPEKNLMISLDNKSISVWSLYDQKKKYSFPIPTLFLSSQNITFIAPASLFLVTTEVENSSIFYLERNLKLVKSSPIALPFSEYIPKHRAVVSFGKDMLVIWSVHTNKVHLELIGSFHNVKFLPGINKLAIYEGLFCDLSIFDLTSDLKLGKKENIYSNDHSFGSMNHLAWIEKTNTLVMTDSILGKVVVWRYKGNSKWNKLHEVDKEGILLQGLMLNDDIMMFTWNSSRREDTYLMNIHTTSKFKVSKDVKRVKHFSPENKSIISYQGNSTAI